MVSKAFSLGGAIGQPSFRPVRRRQLLKKRRAEEDENTDRERLLPLECPYSCPLPEAKLSPQLATEKRSLLSRAPFFPI